jgi:hypothetical protein
MQQDVDARDKHQPGASQMKHLSVYAALFGCVTLLLPCTSMADQQGPADLYIVTSGSATLVASFPNIVVCIAAMKASAAYAPSGTSPAASVMCIYK